MFVCRSLGVVIALAAINSLIIKLGSAIFFEG